MAKRESAYALYHRVGVGEDAMDEEHVVEVVANLYAKGLAEAWFVGMGWAEGWHYCQEIVYLRYTAAAILLKNNKSAVWHACRFLPAPKNKKEA